MKSTLQQIGIILFVITFFWAYHLALNWLASIIGWEGTAIGLSFITFFIAVFIAGAGRLNNEFDSYYAENRIKGLEDQQKADEDIIKTLRAEKDDLKDLIQKLGLEVDSLKNDGWRIPRRIELAKEN